MRSYIFRLAVCVSVVLCFLSYEAFAQAKVGDLFPAWTEGCLDIHHINTGKGEASFLMLPDGTTMLTDAGATTRSKPRVTDPKPDGSRTPGDWISRYILRMLQNRPEKKLNHVLLTHFHDDHLGGVSPEMKKSKAGYVLSGLTEVCENIPFDKLVDRGWPDYSFPEPQTDDFIVNYIEFAKRSAADKGVRVERFNVGAADQFPLIYNSRKYPNFEIRNLAANGRVWTGVATNVRNHFPPIESLSRSQYPSENMCSSAFRLSYGKFDYFNGADITTGDAGTWQDIETPVGLVTGPVEVCLANHHAYYDAMGVSFLQAVRPRVFIIQLWSPGQPDVRALSAMLSTGVYPGPRDIFSTNLMPETKVVIGTRLDRLKSTQGHIVIRVSPGGDNFMIYILDDSSESFRIKSVHGPYACD